jgi:hypothetical protein
MMMRCFSSNGEDMAGKVGPPLVIDLGRIEREDVGQLLSGAGTVLDEVDMAMGLVCQPLPGLDACTSALQEVGGPPWTNSLVA